MMNKAVPLFVAKEDGGLSLLILSNVGYDEYSIEGDLLGGNIILIIVIITIRSKI